MSQPYNFEDLSKKEFDNLVINIFYNMGYDIDVAENFNFNYFLEKEELKFILKIDFKYNNERCLLEDVFKFQNDVVNTKSWRGYYITNENFEMPVYEEIENFKNNIRLFNKTEIQRLGGKIIN